MPINQEPPYYKLTLRNLLWSCCEEESHINWVQIVRENIRGALRLLEKFDITIDSSIARLSELGESKNENPEIAEAVNEILNEINWEICRLCPVEWESSFSRSVKSSNLKLLLKLSIDNDWTKLAERWLGKYDHHLEKFYDGQADSDDIDKKINLLRKYFNENQEDWDIEEKWDIQFHTYWDWRETDEENKWIELRALEYQYLMFNNLLVGDDIPQYC